MHIKPDQHGLAHLVIIARLVRMVSEPILAVITSIPVILETLSSLVV
jgi:hypothetical protein